MSQDPDSDSSFDLESIEEERIGENDTGPEREDKFINDTTQEKMEGCSTLFEGDLSESRGRAEKVNKPGLVKLNNGSICRAYFVIENDEVTVYCITDGETALELSKKLAPKKTFTWQTAQKVRRVIAKAINDNNFKELKGITMCSVTIDHIIKTQKPPRKRPANADNVEKAGPAKKTKNESLDIPKSPLLKRVRSESSPASTPKSKLRPPINHSELSPNPTGKYSITNQTLTTLTVPTLDELKEVKTWYEAR